jgi:hypothetical protein
MTFVVQHALYLGALALLTVGAVSARAQNDGSAAKSGPIVALLTIDGFPVRASRTPSWPCPRCGRSLQRAPTPMR